MAYLKKTVWFVAVTALGLVILAPPAAQSAEAPLDDVLKGFEDDTFPTNEDAPAEAAKEAAAPSWVRLGGDVSQDVSYNFSHKAPAAGATDHRGLSGLRSRIDLQADLDFSTDWHGRIAGYAFHDWAYGLRGRNDYTPQFLARYENEVRLGETYIQGNLRSDIDLKVGRQIVVWGKSDSIRVVDVLNPLDSRLPGRTDIEDLRLPVTMAKVDYYTGDWNLSAIVIPEIRFNKTAVYGSDFYPLSTPAVPRDDPDEGFGDVELALALNGVFSGWDLSFYGARIYDNQAHGEQTAVGLRLRYSRLNMAGVAANVASGNWLFKGEAAYLDGIEYRQAPGRDFSRGDVLAGVEYSGFRDTTISVEAANRHVFGFDKTTKGSSDDGRRNDFQTAARVTKTFLNETLEVSFLAATHGLSGANGGYQRLQAMYDWSDSIKVTVGVINHMSGDKLSFTGIGDNDRGFLKIQYSF